MNVTTAPTPNSLIIFAEETRPTRELRRSYHFPKEAPLHQAKDIIGRDFTINTSVKILSHTNHEIYISFEKAFIKREKLLGEDKELVKKEGLRLVEFLSTMNYRKVKVEILPEDSIIFRLDIEPGLQIVITKFYSDKDTRDGNPLISIIQDKEIIYHNRVSIETFVNVVRPILG